MLNHTVASPKKYQMAVDAHAAGGHGGPRALVWEAVVASVEDLATAFEAKVTAGSGLGWGHRAHRGKAKEKDKEWSPFTKLGHLVKDKKIKSLVSLGVKC